LSACIYGAQGNKMVGGSTVYSIPGSLCPTLSGLTTTHPDVGAVNGKADIVSAMAWSVDASAKQAIIITTLGGVPDAGVAVAADDYLKIVENTSSLKSISFDVLNNDVALKHNFVFDEVIWFLAS
jgi:hypothetical protein